MAPHALKTGVVFDIQGFSVHDGPGCRTLIFLKGCSLKCQWCSNPEGISPFPEPLWHAGKCIFDRLCIQACPHNAISIQEERLSFDRMKCAVCTTFECTKACCTGALKEGGYHTTIDQLWRIITRDRQYWGSRGGITLTGGEPFSQPEFVHDLLQQCYEAYIHTAAETCGNVPWSNISASLPWLDWLFFDLKHMDSGVHRSITGSPNHLILSNAMQAGKEFKGRLIFRMPLIPGINSDPENILATASFIRSAGKAEINILPLHHLGREKYSLLGQPYYTSNFHSPLREELDTVQALFESNGVTCHIGSSTPF